MNGKLETQTSPGQGERLDFSIIIAAPPDQLEVTALAASRRMDFSSARGEILLARGTQPSVQRNTAVRQAKGNLIYFLDDDSEPATQNPRRALTHFQRAEVEVLGGPNLCPINAPLLEQCFAAVLGSRLAFGPSRARYLAAGPVRETGEKELILCNLIIRRETFLRLGGFDESLYPNEENALMDAIQARGGKLIYDPDFIVHRHPRKTLRLFLKMLLNYGRGRAEQFRLHPTRGSWLNFMPALFCLYLPWALVLGQWWLAPLVLYGLAVILEGWRLPAPNGRRYLRVAGLIVLTHLSYGLGFWRGLFTRIPPRRDSRNIPVTLEMHPL